VLGATSRRAAVTSHDRVRVSAKLLVLVEKDNSAAEGRQQRRGGEAGRLLEQLARDVVVVGHAARARGVIDLAVALLRARIDPALDRIAFVAT